jgi:hypothetical protein
VGHTINCIGEQATLEELHLGFVVVTIPEERRVCLRLDCHTYGMALRCGRFTGNRGRAESGLCRYAGREYTGLFVLTRACGEA